MPARDWDPVGDSPGQEAAASSAPQGVPAPGEWIAGRYRVERVLARGGMGLVVQAEHVVLGKRVAVKLLLQDVASDEGALQRFLDEARIAAQLPGDHIARALDFGRTDRGDAYLVMELLVGRDLEAELRRRGRLPVREGVDLVLQACEGVAEAHAVGLVHRDLKPANLFLTRRRDGSALIKVLDFGISKRTLGGAPTTIATRSAACGTPAYMAPEQLLPLVPVDARCDQHGLAMVLFELITGRRAFSADSLVELSVQILDMAAPRLASSLPAAPPGLDEAIARALAKNPEARFPDLAGFAEAIAPFGGPGAVISAHNVAQVLQGVLAHHTSAQTGPCWSRGNAPTVLNEVHGDALPAVVTAPGQGDVGDAVTVSLMGALGGARQDTPAGRSFPLPQVEKRTARMLLAMLAGGAAVVSAVGGAGALLDAPGLPDSPAATGIASATHRALSEVRDEPDPVVLAASGNGAHAIGHPALPDGWADTARAAGAASMAGAAREARATRAADAASMAGMEGTAGGEGAGSQAQRAPAVGAQGARAKAGSASPKKGASTGTPPVVSSAMPSSPAPHASAAAVPRGAKAPARASGNVKQTAREVFGDR